MTSLTSAAGHGVGAASGGHGHGTVEDHDRKARAAVLLLLASDFVFVAALFFTYLYLRLLNVDNRWLPSGVHPVPTSQALVLAGMLVVSTAAFYWGQAGIRRGQVARLRTGLTVAYVIWAAEFVLQLRYLASMGFLPSQGGYAAAFTVLSGYHAVHLALGLLLGLGLLIRAARGRYTEHSWVDVEVVGYFWAWATIMAVGMALLPR